MSLLESVAFMEKGVQLEPEEPPKDESIVENVHRYFKAQKRYLNETEPGMQSHDASNVALSQARRNLTGVQKNILNFRAEAENGVVSPRKQRKAQPTWERIRVLSSYMPLDDIFRRSTSVSLRTNAVKDLASWAKKQPVAIDGLLPLPSSCGPEVAAFLGEYFQFMRENTQALLSKPNQPISAMVS